MMEDERNLSEHLTGEMIQSLKSRIRKGGREARKSELKNRGKWLARERLDYLLDKNCQIEDWILARCDDSELPADGLVTVVGKIDGRRVCVMANDMSVKAGTWGVKTIKKIQRIQEVALNYRVPMIYLVDSGGARIDEQFGMYLDRMHAGRIFWNMSRMNGVVPQICVNFGPSPAGAAYLPAFCDLVIMLKGQTSVFLGSPRQVEAATGERVTAEELGGAEMHCQISGLGDILVDSEEEALDLVRKYLSFMPSHWTECTHDIAPISPARDDDLDAIVPANERRAFDMQIVIDNVIDNSSWLEVKKEYAGELITGLARLGGIAVGIVANQSKIRGGILMADSAEKGAQFISLCSAYQIPLVFLMDVPGFMISSKSERKGIIRRGQKMLQAVAEATQARVCVVVRKGYGAGYMAMSGATFQPDAMIALPQARLGMMGSDAAVKAIYGRKLAVMEPEMREEFIQRKKSSYLGGIGVLGPAAEMYLDDIVPGNELREQLISRLKLYRKKSIQSIDRGRNRIMRG